MISRAEKKYSLALQYFRDAIKIRFKLNQKNGIASTVLEIARTFHEQKKYDSSFVYFEKSLELHEEINNKMYMALCHNGMGNVYYELGEYQKALDEYDLSLKLDSEDSRDYGIVNNRIGKALVYSKINNRQLGEKELKAASEAAFRTGISTKIIDTYEAYTKFYMNLSDVKGSQEKFDTFLFMNDSLFAKQQFETLTEIQKSFAVSQKLNEMNLQLEIEKTEKFYFVVFIIMVTIFASVLFWRYRTSAKLNKQLKLMNESKDKLFSIIAHDLKNPFLSLMGYTDLLKEKGISESDRDELLSGLDTTTKNTYTLLENLLNFSASRTGKIEYSPSFFRLNTVVDNVIRNLDSQLSAKAINVSISLDADKIFGDLQMIEIVLRNIISNAIKFSMENGIIKISSHFINNYCSISISDNGIGMDSEQKEKLFSSEIIKSNPGTAGEKGTGIGLALCREFIEKHGGTIGANSEPGEGSQFTILIPQKTATK